MRTLIRYSASLLAAVALSAVHAAPPDKESWLGLPVEYASQGYAFKGGAVVEMKQVKVQTATPIEISRAWVSPDWADWVTEFRTNRVRVEAGEITARPSSLARLGSVDGPSTKIITRMSFTGMKLLFGSKTLSLPAGEMQFKGDGTLNLIRVSMESGVNLELSPRDGGKLGILVQTARFNWPVLPAFRFEAIAAQGEIGDDSLLIDRIGANGDGGAMGGELRLTAVDQFQLEGELTMTSLRAQEVLGRLYPRPTVSGVLSGSFKLSANGDTLESLAKTLVVEGEYALKSGMIDRFGLLEGMRRSTPGVVGGGLLRIDQISGKFKGAAAAPAQVDFKDLKAGALRGAADIVVEPDARLKGRVRGSMVFPGGETSARSFELSGKVDAPTLIAR